MKYRILAIDLDGTLLRSDESLSQRNLAAIEAAQAAGVTVVPCTGRVWHRARNVALRRLPHMGLGVFANGCAIHNVGSGRMHSSATMDISTIHRTIELCADLPVLYQLCMLDNGNYGYQITSAPFRDLLMQRWHNQHDGSAVFHPAIRLVERADLDSLSAPILIRVATNDVDILGELHRRLVAAASSLGASTLLYSDRDGALASVELYSAGMNKWASLERLGGEAGVRPDEIAAIGDNDNDIEMIAHAGCGVAMANASPRVREAADRITLSNDDDGVADAIEKMLGGEW